MHLNSCKALRWEDNLKLKINLEAKGFSTLKLSFIPI